MIKHIHFENCNSTQLYLLENINNLVDQNKNLLISATKQADGVGRKGNKWDKFKNAIAFSFNISPSSSVTMTPLEIGLYALKFLSERFNSKLYLKWPNDILNDRGEKCGGIICNYHNINNIIVGIGINISEDNSDSHLKTEQYKTQYGFISDNYQFKKNDYKNLPKDIYEYILKNRINSITEIISFWKDNCYHINKNVTINDNYKSTDGIFIGIGPNGEAILKCNNKVTSVISGSLFL